MPSGILLGFTVATGVVVVGVVVVGVVVVGVVMMGLDWFVFTLRRSLMSVLL